MCSSKTPVSMKKKRRPKSKPKKPKFLSLSRQFPPDEMRVPAPATQLDLFPLHPDNDRDQAENVALFFSAADGGATTLTGLLDNDSSAVDSNSNSSHTTNNNNTSRVELEYLSPSYGAALVRTALRSRDRDSGEEKWVRYSEVVKEEEVTSSAVDRRVSLKLDYDQIMNAWSNKGPLFLHAHTDTSQIVPDLFLPHHHQGKAVDDQSIPPPRARPRPSRREQADYISAQVAARMQEEADYEAAVHAQEEEMSRASWQQSNEIPEFVVNLEDVDQTQNVQANAPKPRALKSDIFTKHFKKMPRQPDPKDGPNDPERFNAYCNYCNNVYKWSAGGGYGTLKRHMETNHPGEYGITTRQTQLQTEAVGGDTSSGTQVLFKYDHSNATDIMAQYAAMEHQPFRFADKKTYQHCIKKAYCPPAKKIGRSNMLRRIRRQYFDRKRDLEQYLIRLDHKVSICSDIWTDCYHKNNYMGITCHWVDNSWTLQKRLIAFREFGEQHTAHNIAQLIILVLNEYQLINKVFSVGFDNAAANTASIPELIEACAPSFEGKYFHSRCICHILNLCVQDAISMFNESVEPIRQAVKILHNRISIGKRWQKYCRNKKIKFCNFIKDVSTRWNSTYDMINSTLNYKDHLCDFFRTEPEANLTLLPSYWDSCMDLFKLLKSFQTATVELSGVYYCTSVRVVEHCMYIATSFNTCFQRSNLQGIIYFMVDKWLKYFKLIPTVFLIAKVLDPKWKLAGVFEILDVYYTCFSSMNFSNVQFLSGDLVDLDLPNVSELKENLERTLRSLFDEYMIKYGHLNTSRGGRGGSYSSSSSSSFPIDLDLSNPMAQRVASLYQDRSTDYPRGQAQNELDIYLASRALYEDTGLQVDVLDWWSSREKEYPILSIMAKELFAVPASTVSVEQAFSIGGLVLDRRRSNMDERNMEATMLLDDWCKAELRVQEVEWDDGDESPNDEFTESDRSGNDD